MGLHIDSGFNLAGATCIRAQESEEELTRRYWFDETKDGRLVFVAEIHTGNNLRKYIEESEMVLLDQVAERACNYTGASMVFDGDGKILYEQ